MLRGTITTVRTAAAAGRPQGMHLISMRSMSSNYVVLGGDAQFSAVKEAAGGKVLYFTATWCPPCRMIAPIFEKMSASHKTVRFVKIDVDECPEAAGAHKVRSIPTFVFMDGKNKLGEFSGADETKLLAMVEELEGQIDE